MLKSYKTYNNHFKRMTLDLCPYLYINVLRNIDQTSFALQCLSFSKGRGRTETYRWEFLLVN